MRKILVLDTNILLENHNAFREFGDNYVFVPLCVRAELDHKKKNYESNGWNARRYAEITQKFSKKHDLIHEGVQINKQGGRLFETGIYKIIKENGKEIDPLKYSMDIGEKDLNIIRAALVLKYINPDIPVEIVSYDNNLIALARHNGLEANTKLKNEVQIDKIDYGINRINNYRLWNKLERDLENINLNKEEIMLTKQDLKKYGIDVQNPYHNKYFIISKKNEKEFDFRKIFKFNIKENALISSCVNLNETIAGIKAKSLEQAVLIDAIMNPENHVIAVEGAAGTGKTLLALACAYQIISDKRGDNDPEAKLYITRSRDPVGGRDTPPIPGTRVEKDLELYAGIANNTRKILSKAKNGINRLMNKRREEEAEKITTKKKKKGKVKKELKKTIPDFGGSLDELIKQGLVELLNIGNIRGYDLNPNEVYFIDEAQNLEPREIRTAVTRVGEGGKLIVCGDISQIDNPKCKAEYNGLMHLINSITIQKDPKYAFLAAVKLIKSERSRAAEYGAKCL